MNAFRAPCPGMQPLAASSDRVLDVRERPLRTYSAPHKPTLQVERYLMLQDLHTLPFASE
jgi:hypothetical protein